MFKRLFCWWMLAGTVAIADGPVATEWIRSIADGLRTIDTLDATYDLTDTLPDGATTTQTLRVVFERPDRLMVDMGMAALWSDGTNLVHSTAVPGKTTSSFVQQPLVMPLMEQVTTSTAGQFLRMITPDLFALMQSDPSEMVSACFTNRIADPVANELEGIAVWQMDERRSMGPYTATYRRWWDTSLGLVRRAEVTLERANNKTNRSQSSLFQLRELAVNQPVNATLFTPVIPTNAPVFDSMEDLIAAIMKENEADVSSGPAPDFSLQTMDGTTFHLSAQRGKVVVVDFWATWCPPCIKAMPEIEKLFQMFGDSNVMFIGVSTDDPETSDRVLQTVKKLNVTYPIAIDTNQIAEHYAVTSIPVLLLIAPDGSIARRKTGFSPNLAETITRDIQRLLAGESLPPEVAPRPRTRSTTKTPSPRFNSYEPALFPPEGFTLAWNTTNIAINDFPPFENHAVALPPRTLVLAGLTEAVVLDTTDGHRIARIPLHHLPRHANSFVSGMHYLADPRGGTLVVSLAWREPMPNQMNAFMITGASLVGLNEDGSLRWSGGEAYSNSAIRTDAVFPMQENRDALYIAGDGKARLLDAAGEVIAAWTNLPRSLEWSATRDDFAFSILSPKQPLARAVWSPPATSHSEEQP
jgi:peroxiredoxin